jgi:hypothetical protein
MLSFQLESQVIRGVDVEADRAAAFALRVIAAIDGRPLPAIDERRTGRKPTGKAGGVGGSARGARRLSKAAGAGGASNAAGAGRASKATGAAARTAGAAKASVASTARPKVQSNASR